MRKGVLRGREHTGIGQIACVAEGDLAAAISRGGAPKRYAYSDPNEDAVGFGQGPGGRVLVVAAGHGGHQASEQAVNEVLALAADWTRERLPAEPWEHAASRIVAHIHDAIRTSGVSDGYLDSRTTLAFAVVRPAEGLWCWASVGDSHIFRSLSGETSEFGPNQGKLLFLGAPMRESDELGLRFGHEPLAGVRSLTLASDGISERGIGVDDPAGAVADALASRCENAAHLRPLETARALTEIALASHRSHDAGDNIACAVWLRP
jgi:serine/threonine protein phosphatase PrpC